MCIRRTNIERTDQKGFHNINYSIYVYSLCCGECAPRWLRVRGALVSIWGLLRLYGIFYLIAQYPSNCTLILRISSHNYCSTYSLCILYSDSICAMCNINYKHKDTFSFKIKYVLPNEAFAYKPFGSQSKLIRNLCMII